MSAKHFEEFEPERLVKSTDRVRDLGEVFTPSNIVDDMLNLLPDEMWQVHPSATFLEPSVGNGNFVSAIFSRKLSILDEAFAAKSLPAGLDFAAAEFHALEAISSIYGVDISEDNIIGGTPGHEVACRPRLIKIAERWHAQLVGSDSSVEGQFLHCVRWIVEHNMIIGNMLARDASGKPTGRDDLALVEYLWHAKDRSVEVRRTTIGATIQEAEDSASDVLSLFGPEPAVSIWAGEALQLYKAASHATTSLTGDKVTNSKGENQ